MIDIIQSAGACIIRNFAYGFAVLLITATVLGTQLLVTYSMDSDRREHCHAKWAPTRFQSEYRGAICYVKQNGVYIPDENLKLDDFK